MATGTAPGEVERPEPATPGDGSPPPDQSRPHAWSRLSQFRPSPYLLLSTMAVLFAVALSRRQPWGTDFGLHAAVVGRIRDNLLDPANPMVAAHSPSPYFTPYTVLLGMIAWVTGAAGAVVLSAAAPVNLALLLYGLRRFVGLFTDSRWAPVLALLFVPLLWGTDVLQWSGFPALRGLVLTLPYPSTAAFGLMLLCWVALAGAVNPPPSIRPGALATPALRRWALTGLLGGLLVLVHPFTALCGAVGALALAIGRLRRLDRADLVGMLTGVAITVALVLGWPYFRVTDLLASASELDEIHRRLYTDPVANYGFAFVVGVPALVLRLRRDRRDPLVLLFAGAGAIALAGGLAGAYALGRVWPVVLLSLQVAAAVELAGLAWRPVGAWRPPLRARWWAAGWAVVAAVACLAGITVQYGNLLLVLPAEQLTPARRAAHGVTNLPDYSWVGRAVGRNEVVLTDGETAGRALLAYEIHAVAPPWPDPLLPDEGRRRADQAELVAPGTAGERRRQLLSEYGVGWILDPQGTYSWADQYSIRVVDGPGRARLLKL